MNRRNVAKWCREFKAGKSDIHDEERRGRPSVVTDELNLKKLKKKFKVKCWFKIEEKILIGLMINKLHKQWNRIIEREYNS